MSDAPPPPGWNPSEQPPPPPAPHVVRSGRAGAQPQWGAQPQPGYQPMPVVNDPRKSKIAAGLIAILIPGCGHPRLSTWATRARASPQLVLHPHLHRRRSSRSIWSIVEGIMIAHGQHRHGRERRSAERLSRAPQLALASHGGIARPAARADP